MQAAPQDGGVVPPCQRSCVQLQWHPQVQHQTEANQHQIMSPCLLRHAMQDPFISCTHPTMCSTKHILDDLGVLLYM
ncbi:unnamed protein product, partial [Urochloa humidicola]